MSMEYAAEALFPRERPPISVSPLDEAPFPVDCAELRWWFVRPVVGEERRWAIYDYDSQQGCWLRGGVTSLRVTAPAEIHGVEGVEIEVREEPAQDGDDGIRTMYGRLTDDVVGWLAVLHETGGKRVLTTFLDEGFEEDWGTQTPRRIEVSSSLVVEPRKPDGCVFSRRADQPDSSVVGVWAVTVGERAFRCLRVIDVGPVSEEEVLIEAFVDERGRTVLARRYNGRLWAQSRYKTPWDERLPDALRIVIDGVTFVHWYDCLTDVAFSAQIDTVK